jgi:hypothetical protein
VALSQRRAGASIPRPVAIGLALAAVYVLTVVGTLPFGHNVRPLFEGIGPPPAYRWVNPPPQFKSGNVPPQPSEVPVPLGPQGSEQSGAQSEDNQLVLNLAPKAAPPHPPDTTMTVRIEPLDPAALGPPPPDLRANGNAYRVTLTYQPSGTPVGSVTSPGNILLTVPEPTAGLLYSPDGKAWQRIGGQTVAGQPIVGAPFNAPGYYLGAAHPTTATTSPGGGGGGVSGTIIVAVIVAVLALGLVLFPVIRRRIRNAPSKPAQKKRKR